MNLFDQHPKASPQHRLGGYALDLALMISTCGIGWFIWSLVIWDQGLTPAKQILKMKVVSSQSGLPARWGHMAIRQFLIPIAFSLPFTLMSGALGGYNVGLSVASILVTLMGWAVTLTDAFWIFSKGQNRRITDLWAKTDVLNTATTLAPKYQTVPQSQF